MRRQRRTLRTLDAIKTSMLSDIYRSSRPSSSSSSCSLPSPSRLRFYRISRDFLPAGSSPSPVARSATLPFRSFPLHLLARVVFVPRPRTRRHNSPARLSRRYFCRPDNFICGRQSVVVRTRPDNMADERAISCSDVFPPHVFSMFQLRHRRARSASRNLTLVGT